MNFYQRLKTYRSIISHQQYRTIKGQANAGDMDGAERGLAKIVERWRKYGHFQSQD